MKPRIAKSRVASWMLDEHLHERGVGEEKERKVAEFLELKKQLQLGLAKSDIDLLEVRTAVSRLQAGLDAGRPGTERLERENNKHGPMRSWSANS
jgi:hypothetical protein